MPEAQALVLTNKSFLQQAIASDAGRRLRLQDSAKVL
jgi:hypothetical protein